MSLYHWKMLISYTILVCLVLEILVWNNNFLIFFLNCLVMSDSLWPHGLYCPWNSPGQNTGVGSLFHLQGIFPTQGSNPGLPHCRQILYQMSHQGRVNGFNFRMWYWLLWALSPVCMTMIVKNSREISQIGGMKENIEVKCTHPL